MPAVMPVSAVSSPMPSRDTSRAASSNETSVKTAIAERSESDHAPDPLARCTAARPGAVRHVAGTIGGNDLVDLRDRPLGRDADALRLAAHAKLLDAGAVVLDDQQL